MVQGPATDWLSGLLSHSLYLTLAEPGSERVWDGCFHWGEPLCLRLPLKLDILSLVNHIWHWTPMPLS